jgi:hypothetical protein
MTAANTRDDAPRRRDQRHRDLVVDCLLALLGSQKLCRCQACGGRYTIINQNLD